jgi:hypothetical protein
VAQPPSAVKPKTHNDHGAQALRKRNVGDPSHSCSPQGGIIEPSALALDKLEKGQSAVGAVQNFARSAAFRSSKPKPGLLGAVARGPAALGTILFGHFYGPTSDLSFRRPKNWKGCCEESHHIPQKCGKDGIP